MKARWQYVQFTGWIVIAKLLAISLSSSEEKTMCVCWEVTSKPKDAPNEGQLPATKVTGM